MEILEAIQIALPVFVEHKDSDIDLLGQALEDAGVSSVLTTKLLEFMPLAFGRVFMDGMGIRFEDYYLRHNSKTKKNQKKMLCDELVYRESFEVASFIIAQKMAGEAFKAVAFRSSELAAVNDLLNKGSQPGNLLMSPPVMLGDEEINAKPNDSKPENSGNRWRFWK
jgi:hypothetical protein